MQAYAIFRVIIKPGFLGGLEYYKDIALEIFEVLRVWTKEKGADHLVRFIIFGLRCSIGIPTRVPHVERLERFLVCLYFILDRSVNS